MNLLDVVTNKQWYFFITHHAVVQFTCLLFPRIHFDVEQYINTLNKPSASATSVLLI